PVRVEQRRGAITPLADVGGERRVDEHEAHLLRDGREGVPHHLEADRVEGHRRSSRIAPERWTRPRHPGSTSAVASPPARIAGPSSSTPAASSPSGHTLASTRAPPTVAVRRARGARWNDAITSIRSAAAARPSALRTPGCGGSTIVRIPSASASAQPKSGPAPPYGNRASCRGSNPRATLTRLSARAIVAAATATI